jgi:hypothetical protein
MNDLVSLAEKKTGVLLNEKELVLTSILFYNLLPHSCAGYLPLYIKKIYYEVPILDRLEINAAGEICPVRFSPCKNYRK